MDPGVLADLITENTMFLDQIGFIFRKTNVRQSGSATGSSTVYLLASPATPSGPNCCRTGITSRMPYEDVEGEQIASNKQYNWLWPVGTDVREPDILSIGPTRYIGDWNIGTNYNVGDGVTVQGQNAYPTVWVALTSNVGVVPAAGSTWQRCILDEVEATDRNSADIPTLLVSTVNRV